MLAPRLMPEMIISGISSSNPVTARCTQSVGVPFTNRKPFAEVRTESGRSRVSELEAPLRSRSGATTVTLARSESASARTAMPGAKYPSSLLSRMRTFALTLAYRKIRVRLFGSAGTRDAFYQPGRLILLGCCRPATPEQSGNQSIAESSAGASEQEKSPGFVSGLSLVLVGRQKVSDPAHPALNPPLPA